MRITLYRLTDGAAFDKSVLRNAGAYKEVDTERVHGAELLLFVKDGHTSAAKWVHQLGLVTKDKDDLKGLNVASSAAVLLAKSNEVVFAICFGSGYHAVDPAKYTRGFGVRVTANAIAGTKIKSADTRGLNRDGRSQKVVLPVASELGALGIEPTEEWVRQLSGTVTATDFASTASGADSLRLSIKDFKLLDIGTKLANIEEFWKSDGYKGEFGFLDNFTKLDSQDPLVAALDAEVTALVIAKSDEVYFAAPDPFEQRPADEYQLSYRKKAPFDELEQAQVYAALSVLKLPDEDPLRKVTVAAFDADGTRVDSTSLYEYVQAELPKGGSRYVLSAGVWFRVADGYVQQVRDYLANVEDLTDELDLPKWPKQSDSEKYIDEGRYNKAVAKAKNYANLDTKNLHFGQYQKIEVCDLLSSERQLICVKRASKSSTLSHLFAQGNVSSSLMHEPKYQSHVMTAMALISGPTDWGNSSDWTVVFAIGTPKSGPLAETLFFFSQVNLMATVRDIRSRNIKVAIARIEQ